MLNEKREFFSFEDDTKEYDPSSNSPPKLTWLLLDCLWEVFQKLVGSKGLITMLELQIWMLFLHRRSYPEWK